MYIYISIVYIIYIRYVCYIYVIYLGYIKSVINASCLTIDDPFLLNKRKSISNI